MNKTIDILKRINKEGPGVYKEKSPSGKLDKIFSIREVDIPLTNKNLSFIQKMNGSLSNDMKSIEGIERYYFDIDFAIVEILISIDKEKNFLTVEPFILYDEQEIHAMIQKVMYREFKLYCLLKKWDLQ